MPDKVMPGRLRTIRVLSGTGGWRVGLGFVDDNGRQRVKTYPEATFLNAMKLLSTPDRKKRLEGLKLLGTTIRRTGAFSEVYLLAMDDGQAINLGDPHAGPSGGNDILLAVHEKSLRPNEIRQALLNRRPHRWDLNFS